MSHSTDCFASSGSTRMFSYSPSSTSSFDPAVLSTTVPFSLSGNDNQQQVPWSYDGINNNDGSYTGSLFGPPHGATQQAVVEAAVLHSASPPTVQLYSLSLSSSPSHSPSGPVTYVQSLPIMAPRPVSSSPPLIGRGWPTTFQAPPVYTHPLTSEPPTQAPAAIPPRPPVVEKIPPEKGRKSFPCLQSGCGMKFPKRNALMQHMRSHTGERPEVCAWCNRAFSLKCNLRRHWRTCKTKKAIEAASAVKKDPSYSPPPFDPSPSPDASSPSVAPAAVAGPSHSSPSAGNFASPPPLWDPGFSVPANYPSAMDMNCGNLYPHPFTTYPPYPTLVPAQF